MLLFACCAEGEELASVLQSVLHTFSTLSGIFIGVTDAEEASSDGSLQDGNLKTSDGSSSATMVNHWTISPAVSVLTLQRAVRSCLITCSQGLSTLHDAQKEGMCMLQAAAGDNFKQLRDDEVECLTKGITSVPILEVCVINSVNASLQYLGVFYVLYMYHMYYMY